jgi:hypothetical protein
MDALRTEHADIATKIRAGEFESKESPQPLRREVQIPNVFVLPEFG